MVDTDGLVKYGERIRIGHEQITIVGAATVTSDLFLHLLRRLDRVLHEHRDNGTHEKVNWLTLALLRVPRLELGLDLSALFSFSDSDTRSSSGPLYSSKVDSASSSSSVSFRFFGLPGRF